MYIHICQYSNICSIFPYFLKLNPCITTFISCIYLYFTQCVLLEFISTVLSHIIFFMSGFFFTNIHDSQDSRGRGRLLLLTRLHDFHTLLGHLDISRSLMQRVHLFTELAARFELGTFGFRVQVTNH